MNLFRAFLILELEVRFRDCLENAARDPAIATEGSYQACGRSNLLSHDNRSIGVFKQTILLPAVNEYPREVFGSEAPALKYRPFAWTNILRAGDRQRPHNHASTGNIISGVYYVKVPEETPPNGSIDFLSPIPVSVHHGCSPCRRIQPAVGKLLLSPLTIGTAYTRSPAGIRRS